MLLATTVAHSERWSKGSRYPVSAMTKVRMTSTTPMTQLSSRGYLYAPKKKVRAMCRKIRITITDEPHLCMPRTNSPRKTSLVMWRGVAEGGGGGGVGGSGVCR